MQQNFAAWFKSLQIIFIALLVGMILISIILYFFVAPPVMEAETPFRMIGGTIFVLLIIGSNVVFISLLKTAQAQPRLEEKLHRYRKARVVKYAMLEAAVLINIILFYFVAGDSVLRVLSAIGIAVFATQFPSRDRLVGDLELNPMETAQLDSPAFTVTVAGEPD